MDGEKKAGSIAADPLENKSFRFADEIDEDLTQQLDGIEKGFSLFRRSEFSSYVEPQQVVELEDLAYTISRILPKVYNKILEAEARFFDISLRPEHVMRYDVQYKDLPAEQFFSDERLINAFSAATNRFDQELLFLSQLTNVNGSWNVDEKRAEFKASQPEKIDFYSDSVLDEGRVEGDPGATAKNLVNNIIRDLKESVVVLKSFLPN